MKRNLLSIISVVATAPAFAQSTGASAPAPELSTLSLIAAGVIALGLARRMMAKH